MVMLLIKKRRVSCGSRYVEVILVKVNGGETVCLRQIQVIDYDSFFLLRRILPHLLPHIKIRVTEGVSASALDLIIGSGS